MSQINILEIPENREIFFIHNIVKISQKVNNNYLQLEITTLDNKTYKIKTKELDIKKLFKTVNNTKNKLW
jgi:hypothetical protein